MTENILTQFKELILKEPRHALPMISTENCPYNSFLYKSRNCHLCFASSRLEDCLNCEICMTSKDCSDCSYCEKCELCYECTDCLNCYNSNYCQDLVNSQDCSLCFDCLGCKNCLACATLRSKEYHFLNQALSKEEYQKKLEEYTKNPKAIQEKFHELEKKTPRVYMRGHNNENVFGDYNNNSKNCMMAFGGNENEDCIYLFDELYNNKDCIDITHTHNSELCYETGSCDQTYNCNCMFISVGNRDCEYCIWCEQCEHCFMCVNLKHKRFHILNQGYSQEEYFKKVAEIKQELELEHLLGQNLLYLATNDVQITKNGDDCSDCGVAFKILEEELKFYQKKKIAKPKNCSDCRQKHRLALRNEYTLYRRHCDKCKKDIISTFDPESKFKIYCAECFLAYRG